MSVSSSKRKDSGSDSDSKPGKKEDFQRFKRDLAKVVIERKITDEFQYLMGIDDRENLFTFFLVSCFTALTDTLKTQGHIFTTNQVVMDLWAKSSGEGMTALEAEEHGL